MAEDSVMISNPITQENGDINLTIDHPDHGLIIFTASPNDPEDHGKDIYWRAMDGEFGEPVEYKHQLIKEV